MSFFNATLEAAAAGQTVRASLLAQLEFLSVTRRLWQGFGPLVAGGQTWDGIGEVVSIDGLELRTDTAAIPLVMKLSGVSTSLISKAAAAETEVKGRPCKIFLQFFNADWSTLDSPVAVWTGVMDTIPLDGGGPDQRALTLSSETVWAARKQARFARYTDRDQQSRFPGDKGCEFIPALVNAIFPWPKYS